MADPRFKVASYELGAADVKDRATNDRVGYVLEDFYCRWEPFCINDRGNAIGGKFQYRQQAAEFVWEHHEKCTHPAPRPWVDDLRVSEQSDEGQAP